MDDCFEFSLMPFRENPLTHRGRASITHCGDPTEDELYDRWQFALSLQPVAEADVGRTNLLPPIETLG